MKWAFQPQRAADAEVAPLTLVVRRTDNPRTVTERYDRFWAEYLGVSPGELNQPGVSIVAHVGLQGYGGVWCFCRRDRTVGSAPPGWIPYLRSRLVDADHERLLA